MSQSDIVNQRAIQSIRAAFFRDKYEITLAELQMSAPSFREEAEAAWSRYWRQECEAGRGVQVISQKESSRDRPSSRSLASENTLDRRKRSA
jgi:hypothetical protein